MSLKDLKNAAAARQQQAAAPPEEPVARVQERASAPAAADGRTKLLGARVPLAVHREFQGYIFRAQEGHPDLTTQAAMPALIRLLRDETVWQKFLAELDKS